MSTNLTYIDGNLLEDVTRVVVNISPIDTPVLSSIGKTRAYNTLHQWPIDSLASRANSPIVEGTTVTYTAVAAPTRVTNYTQLMSKTYAVSSAERSVKGAGVDDMFIYQKGRALKELANNMEYALLTATSSAGTATEARQMKGLLSFIATNASVVVSGTKLTESLFVGLLQIAWAQGGNPDTVWVGSYMKRAITAFTTGGTRFVDASSKKLTANVSVYESPFGIVEVELSRDVPNTDLAAVVVCVERSRLKMAILDPVTVKDPSEVAQTIYGSNGYVFTEISLEVGNEAGLSKGTGYTTSI